MSSCHRINIHSHFNKLKKVEDHFSYNLKLKPWASKLLEMWRDIDPKLSKKWLKRTKNDNSRQNVAPVPLGLTPMRPGREVQIRSMKDNHLKQ